MSALPFLFGYGQFGMTLVKDFALRGGRAKTDGIITHRFSLDDYGKALDALQNDPDMHKIVIVP